VQTPAAFRASAPWPAAAPYATALLHAWMDAERGRFALWLPVFVGAGVLLYFAQTAEPAWWLPAAGAAAALALTILGWRSPVPRAAGLALLMAAFGVAAGQGATRRALALAVVPTRASLIEGTVRGLEILPDGRRITLDAARIGADPPLARTIHLRLRASDPAAPLAGDTVRVRALLRPPAPPAFPGARDPQREAFFAGTAGSGMALGPLAILASAPPDGLARWGQSVRDRIAARILAAIPGPHGAIAATMLTGTGSAIPEPDRAAFRDSGLAHLLAVAGLHIGIVMGLVMGATRFALALWEYAALRWPTRQIAALTALAAGGGYALLTGGYLPILRSFAMAALVTLGLLLGRRAASLRGLALAATLLLLAQPQEIMGVSFRMSFSAVLALIAGYEAARPWLTRLRVGDGSPGLARRAAAHLVPLALTSLLAGTASAPYAAAAFGHVQLYFIVANMLAVPLTALWVMPAGLLGLALMPLHCERLALVPMGWGVGVVLWIGRTVSSWPAATLAVAHIPDWGLCVVTLGLAWLGLWRSRLRLLGAPVLLAGLASPLLARPPDLLVSADARLIAFHVAGQVFLQSASGARADRDAWAQVWNAAPQPLPDEGDPAPGLHCDPDRCVLTHGAASIALTRPAIRPRCDASLLVTAEPLHGACPGQPHIDRFTVWRDGAQAAWLTRDGVLVISDRDWRGTRPWVPPPPGSKSGHVAGGGGRVGQARLGSAQTRQGRAAPGPAFSKRSLGQGFQRRAFSGV